MDPAVHEILHFIDADFRDWDRWVLLHALHNQICFLSFTSANNASTIRSISAVS